MSFTRRLIAVAAALLPVIVVRPARAEAKSDPAATKALLEAMRAAPRPTVVLKAGRGGSAIGGRPHLPADVRWPETDGRPISFVAELDLVGLRANGGPDWLPQAGYLFFFYDNVEMPWGFDPKDGGRWTVIHAEPSATARPYPDALGEDDRFDRVEVQASPGVSYPSPERLGTLRDTDFDVDAVYGFLEEADGAGPNHRVGGYPSPMQSDDMEREAQLASNGVYLGDGTGYASAQAKRLEGGAADWRLLLQIDSDDAAGMMWGDAGLLYFWVREQDARAGDFSKVWLILQCA